DDLRDSIPAQHRAFHPEEGDLGLLSGPAGAIGSPETFYFIEVRRIPFARQLIRGLCVVLGTEVEHERSDVSPSRAGGEREARDKLEISRIGAWDVVEIQERGVRPISSSEREDGRGCLLAGLDTFHLGWSIRDGRKGDIVSRLNESQRWN